MVKIKETKCSQKKLLRKILEHIEEIKYFFKKYAKTKWNQIYFRINIVQLKKNIFMEIDSKARGGKANGFEHIIFIYRLKKCLLEYIYLNIVCF